MKATFEQFDYDVHQLKATSHSITTLLKQVTKYLSEYQGGKYNEPGCKKVVIFAFSGHGTISDQIKTQDLKILHIKEEIIVPLVGEPKVFEIPKLFFIDACRGGDHLQPKGDKQLREKGFTEVEGNYRLDYSTIPDHLAYAGDNESKWMPKLARALREDNDSLQNVAAKVRESVHEVSQHKQQCESLDRLNGVLKLYFKK